MSNLSFIHCLTFSKSLLLKRQSVDEWFYIPGSLGAAQDYCLQILDPVRNCQIQIAGKVIL